MTREREYRIYGLYAILDDDVDASKEEQKKAPNTLLLLCALKIETTIKV